MVAQEHIEDELALGTNKSDKKEDKGILGAISSIFKNKDENNKKSNNKDSNGESINSNIFDGVDVGGATKHSRIEWDCSDPFMDEEECHLIYDEPKVSIDRHRWAHPLFHVEPGCILVANEKLGGVFNQAVVLIIDHNENTGSTGMVINRYVKCLCVSNLICFVKGVVSGVKLTPILFFHPYPNSDHFLAN